MSEKVFDRLDLLAIFGESGQPARVSSFQGWKTTDDRGRQLPDPQPITHEVYANVAAYYCEKGGFAIVRKTVSVSQDFRLEPYRDQLRIMTMTPVWEAINNVTNNAALMRQIVDMADRWRDIAIGLTPEDLPKPLAPDARMLPFDEEGRFADDGDDEDHEAGSDSIEEPDDDQFHGSPGHPND